MGGVDRTTSRTAAALLIALAVLFALPAAAAAAPPDCPTQLTVDVDDSVVIACSDPDGDQVTYPTAPQPTKGTVTVRDGGGFVYRPNPGTAGEIDEFALTAEAGTESTTVTLAVAIKSRPTVMLAASPTTATTGQAVSFTATAEDPDGGDALTYAWTVDDDEPIEAGATITRPFPDAGEHTVSVEVTDDDNATNTASTTVQVSDPPNQPPVADFDFAPAEPVVGDEVTFTSRSSDPEGEMLTLEWDLDGDGAFEATGSTVTTVYMTAGTRVVRLRASDADHAPFTQRSVVVAAKPPPPATESSPPPAVDQAPPTPPTAVVADTTAPAFGISRPAVQRLARIRRRGLRFAVRCSDPCSVYLEVLVSRRTARRLRIDRRARGPVRIGRVLAKAGPVRRTVTLKLTRRAARRLKGVRRVKLTLQGSAFDAGGFTTLLKPRRISIRR